jgi:hypothetical protein
VFDTTILFFYISVYTTILAEKDPAQQDCKIVGKCTDDWLTRRPRRLMSSLYQQLLGKIIMPKLLIKCQGSWRAGILNPKAHAMRCCGAAGATAAGRGKEKEQIIGDCPSDRLKISHAGSDNK